MKIKLLIAVLLLCFAFTNTFSQISIGGAVPTAPNAASILDLSNATALGLYPPQVALTGTADAITVASPPTSLLIYNTATAGVSPNDVTPGYYYNAGTTAVPNWVRLFSGNNNFADAWLPKGNAGTTPINNFIGTTDDNDLVFKIRNVFSGEIDSAKDNLFLGYKAGINNTTGYSNVALGANTLVKNTIGFWQVAIGDSALYNMAIDPTGNYSDVAVGWASLRTNTSGYNNTAVGWGSLYANTTARDNTALGNQALEKNNTGSFNTATGSLGLFSNTTGIGNTAVGYTALVFDTSGNFNTATGLAALYFNTTGNNNVANGYNSLDLNTTGNDNIGIGDSANFYNKTGYSNVAVGASALLRNTDRSNIVAVGDSALFFNTVTAAVTTDATQNTAIGSKGLFNTGKGSYNTALGYHAGFTNTSGTNNTLLGDSADVATSALTNATAIGSRSKVALSNSLVLGGTGANAVNVGIGTTSPNAAAVLDISAITTKGIYPTQVALTAANAASPLTLPPTSLLVYNTATAGSSPNNVTPGYYYNAGTTTVPNWFRLFSGNNNSSDAWLTTGNRGATAGTNFIGTIDNNNLIFKVNNTFSGEIDDQSGTGNLFLGYSAGIVNTGTYNTFLGFGAGENNISGYNNTATGNYALQGNNSGHENTADGFQALLNNTNGYNNTGTGIYALRANTIGLYNTADGSGSLQANTTGSYNTGSGSHTLISNTSGSNNSAMGYEALYADTSGNNNTAEGYQSLHANTNGSGNTANGYQAGNTNITGTNNTFIGNLADATVSTLTNAAAIGSNAKVSTSNTLILGGTGANAVNVGIGNTTAAYPLDVNGTINTGLNGGNNGTIRFAGNTNANSVSLSAGVTTTSYAMTLPTQQGATNSYLRNGGTGTLTWTVPNAVIHVPISENIYPTSTSNYYTGPPSAIAAAYINNAYPDELTTNPLLLQYSILAQGSTYTATGAEQVSKVMGYIESNLVAATNVTLYLYKYTGITSGTTYTNTIAGTLVGSVTVAMANTSNGVYSFTLTPSAATTLAAGDVLIFFLKGNNAASVNLSGTVNYSVNGTLELLTNTQ
jgi:hypothetical protein